MPIIVAIHDCSEQGKSHKKGTQCNKSAEYAAFLVSTGNWEYVHGKTQTDQEKAFFDKLAEEEKEEESPKKRGRKPKK